MSGKVNEPLIDRLATAVGQGQSVRAACQALGIAERTGKRYAVMPEFKAKVIDIASQINSQAIAIARLNLVRAHVRLAKLLSDENLDPDVAVKAVKAATADFVALDQHLNPGGASARPGAPGLVVPGLDPRWQPGGTAEGGGECSTQTD